MARNDKREIARKLKGCMTVAELKEQLENQPDDALVLFTCDYGDYSHTNQALPVCVAVDMSDLGMWIETSAYSQSGLSLEEVDEDYDEMEDDERPDAEETDARKFVILSSDNLDR